MENAKYKLATPRDGAAAWASFSSENTDRLPRWEVGAGLTGQANAKIGAFLVAEAARKSGAFPKIEENIKAYIASVRKGCRAPYEKELLGKVMGSAEDGPGMTFAQSYPGLNVAEVMAAMAQELGVDSAEATGLAVQIRNVRKNTPKIQPNQNKKVSLTAKQMREIDAIFDRVLIALAAKDASAAKRSAVPPPGGASGSDSDDASSSDSESGSGSKSESESESGSDSDSDSESEAAEAAAAAKKKDKAAAVKAAAEKQAKAEAAAAKQQKKAAAAAAKAQKGSSNGKLDKAALVDAWIAASDPLYRTDEGWLPKWFDERYEGAPNTLAAPKTLRQNDSRSIVKFIDMLKDRTLQYSRVGDYDAELLRASKMSVQAFAAVVAFLNVTGAEGMGLNTKFVKELVSPLFAAEYRIHYAIVNGLSYADSGLDETSNEVLAWPLYDFNFSDDGFKDLEGRTKAAVAAYGDYEAEIEV